MKKLHRFTACLDSHKSLLEILPEGNEYVSLFTGTASVLIKVVFQGYILLALFPL